jgi:Nuclease A inhibitor-like protein
MMIRTPPIALIPQLQAAAEPLLYLSESAYPLQPFTFRVTERRTFGIGPLLQTLGLLQIQTWDTCLSQICGSLGTTPRMRGAFQEIKHTLETQLTQVEVYRVGQHAPGDEGWDDRGTIVFPLLLGQSPEGDWVGLCPKFRADAMASAERIRPTIDRMMAKGADPVTISTLKIISDLKTSLVGYPLIVQSDNACKLVDEFFWKAAATKDNLLNELLQSTGFLKIFPFQGFSNSLVDGYRPEQLTPDQRRFYERFFTLDHLLRVNLTDLQEYIIGGYTHFHLAAIGQTSEGDWAGISTQAVWI